MQTQSDWDLLLNDIRADGDDVMDDDMEEDEEEGTGEDKKEDMGME